MPSRHISPQSFDEILSELGDDPAIADPHGIRKTSSIKHPSPEPLRQQKAPINLETFSTKNLLDQIPKLGLIFAFAMLLAVLAIGLFMTYGSLKTSSETLIEGSKKEISDLKNDLAKLRIELEQERDELYEAIDLLEVSVHSLKNNKPTSKAFTKPQILPHEAELRRWRYLGTSQMGDSHQAFFHTGKAQVIVQKGGEVLGHWRLTSLQKDFATLTHAEGKTVTLSSSKSE